MLTFFSKGLKNTLDEMRDLSALPAAGGGDGESKQATLGKSCIHPQRQTLP